jgi:hypothetical protein
MQMLEETATQLKMFWPRCTHLPIRQNNTFKGGAIRPPASNCFSKFLIINKKNREKYHFGKKSAKVFQLM